MVKPCRAGFAHEAERPQAGRRMGYRAWFSFVPFPRYCYTIRGRRRSFVCLQPGRRAGFIGLSSFLFIGLGSERNGTHNTSSFYATEHEELQYHLGFAFGRQHLLSLCLRVDAGMAEFLNDIILLDTSFCRLLGVAFRGSGNARQAIIVFRKPPCTLTWQMTRAPGLAREHRQGSNILRSSLYLHFLSEYPYHAIWPLQKTMMGSCDRRAYFFFMYPVRQVRTKIPPAG